MKSELIIVPLLLAASIVACAQVTGLGDEYTFDLDAGAGADAVDEAVATTDGAPAPVCSGQAGVSAHGILDGLKGASECMTCFADQCCVEVVDCWPQSGSSDCRNRFECILRCTEKTQRDERDKCFGDCSSKSDTASRAMDDCQRNACQACGLL
jgi:hypothetical protein